MPERTPPVNNRDSIPVPDPTALTTQQSDKAVSCLREIIEARLDGMVHARDALKLIVDKLPEQMSAKIIHLRELQDERFISIQTQFAERDTRTEQLTIASKTAVDAALQAAEKAVGAANTSSSLAISKSETAILKQLDGIVLLMQSREKAIDAQLSDIKERQTLIEGKGIGMGLVVGGVGTVIGILIAVAGILIAVFRN